MDQMDMLTLGIIIANVLFSMRGFKDSSFFNKYKFQIGPIKDKDYIRMISSGFLHVDYMHLFFNMYTLYFFAYVVTMRMGRMEFLVIYFGSLLAGNVLSYLFHKNNNYYSAVGASGAVSGVLFASILLFPEMRLGIMFIPIPIPAYVLGIGYLAYTIFGMKKQLGNIGHAAHLGGAVAGLLLAVILEPSLLQTHTMTFVLLMIPIVVFFFLGKKLNV